MAGMLRRAAAVVLTVLATSPAFPQGSIDAGKSPAQMFADTCSNCHRRPQELRRASASFLRQHYTPGAQEAAAMANYLAAIPAAKDRPKAEPKERAKAQAAHEPPERPSAQDRSPQERPRAQPVTKSKRPELAKSPVSEPPADVPQEVRADTPPVPKLEPFEE
jgi:hypothetical protein